MVFLRKCIVLRKINLVVCEYGDFGLVYYQNNSIEVALCVDDEFAMES